MESPDEKQRKRKAWMTSVSVQVVMLLIFYLLAAYRPPDPPNPEFGIELNFGLQETGGGTAPVRAPRTEEVSEEASSSPQSETESVVEDETSEELNEPIETVDNPNPDVTQESVSASAQVQEVSEQDENEQENTQPAATETDTETNESQGVTGDPGDQGVPEGDINQDALYGNPGGGDNGSTLQLSGWEWDSPPEPNDTSDEAGKIVFEITVDSKGEITGRSMIFSTVSLKVVKKYELAIDALTFSKTSSYKPAPSSKGKITFIIRSR